MTKRAYPLRIPTGLLELADIKSAEERTDRSITLRQWLYTGAERYVLQLLSNGRVSVSRAAEYLDLSVYDVVRLAQENGIEIGATADQHAKAARTAHLLTTAKG